MLPYPVTANIPINRFFTQEPLPFPCPRTPPLLSFYFKYKAARGQRISVGVVGPGQVTRGGLGETKYDNIMRCLNVKITIISAGKLF